jgi:hypothetical protein
MLLAVTSRDGSSGEIPFRGTDRWTERTYANCAADIEKLLDTAPRENQVELVGHSGSRVAGRNGRTIG